MPTLELTAGKPWTKQIIFRDGKNYWTALDQFEIRAQLRATQSATSRLISNLHQFMTPTIVDNDIVASWVMTGQQTRDIYSAVWGINKTGYVNIMLSDVGVGDAKTLVVPVLQLVGKDTTTTGSGVS